MDKLDGLPFEAIRTFTYWGWLDPTVLQKKPNWAALAEVSRYTLGGESMNEIDFLKLAVALAESSMQESGKTPLYVGAVVVRDGKVLASAARGELSGGEHAEYTVLERKLEGVDVSGATLYTTLEPCTTCKHPLISCATMIARRGIKKVVVGILDPNPVLSGAGVWGLSNNNIAIERFPGELEEKIRRLNHASITKQRGGSMTGMGNREDGDQSGGDHFKNDLRELEERLKKAEEQLRQEKRAKQSKVKKPSRNAGVNISVHGVRDSKVTISGGDIGPESHRTQEASQGSVNIQAKDIEGSEVKISGRDIIENYLIRSAETEIKAIKTEISAVKSGVQYKDFFTAFDPKATPDNLKKEVQRILDEKTIRMAYMPIVNFSGNEHEVIGYELLARGPKGSILEKRPLDIFKVAAELNRLVELDLLCVERALEARSVLPSGMKAFINVIPTTFLDSNFQNMIKGAGNNNLVFEIREDLLDETTLKKLTDAIKELKALGFEVAIDDHGSEGANDQRLVKFQPHYLKTDQFFMRDVWINNRETAKKLLKHYADIAQQWNGKVLVEGITERHSEDDLKVLRSLGIFHGQGYLFGEPRETI